MDEFPLSPFTLFLLLASILYFSWKILLINSDKQSAPGPYNLPIVGYLPFLKPDLHRHFTHLAHKYGPIYQLRLGTRLCFVISSPSLIKEIVRDHDTIFANRDPPVAALVLTGGGHDIVWSPYGPYWRDMRKLFVREMLSNNNMQATYDLRKEEVRKLVRNLRGKMGEAVEIGELVFLTEANVIMNLMWGGMKWDKLGSEFRDRISKLVDLLGKPNVSDFLPGLAKFDVQGIEKESRDAVLGVEEILDFVIDERMKMKSAGERRKDFLEILLELKGQEVGERSFDEVQIKAMLMDIIIGGTDTTSTTIEWVMVELLDKPAIMEKVQQELTDVVGLDNMVEESHIPKLQYLDAVVKETFRVHPTLPLIVPRFSSQSCTIGGYTIPKSSRVFLNMWSVYRDPRVWENPLEFQPDRFFSSTEKFDYMGNNFQYLPFGSGRRVCPGLPLGERMMMYLLATLIHSFHWRLPDDKGIDMSETFGIVMRKTKPLHAISYQRLPNLDLYE